MNQAGRGLILWVLIVSGCQSSGTNGQTEAIQLRIVDVRRTFVQEKYDALRSFKNSSDFVYYGFGLGGPYRDWLPSVKEKLNTVRNEFAGDHSREELDAIQAQSVALAELMSLGLAYVGTRGLENDDTMMLNKSIQQYLSGHD